LIFIYCTVVRITFKFCCALRYAVRVRFQDHLPAFGEQFYTSCDRLSDQQIARSTVLKIWEVFKAGFLRSSYFYFRILFIGQNAFKAEFKNR
ncbi:hypothetical protein T4D_6357, partial [Trichinella pseudospiralis]